MRTDQVRGDAPRGEETDRTADQPGLDRELHEIVVGEREVHPARIELGGLISKVDVAIRSEPHPEDGKRAQHVEARAELDEAADVRIAAKALDQRLEADERAVRHGDGEQRADQHEAHPRAARPALHREEPGERERDADDAAAAQRAHERERHHADGDHREVAADAASRRARRPRAGAALVRARPGDDRADAEADQHLEPGGEVIGIDEGAGESRPRGGLPPPEEPAVSAEVVEKRGEREHPAQQQERADQPLERRARPHEIHHEDVHRP